MKKKNIEKMALERLSRIEGLEAMLGRRRAEIMELKGEVQGLRELCAILEAIIFLMVEEKGYVEIERAKLAEGIRQSFSIETTEEKFILKSAEE